MIDVEGGGGSQSSRLERLLISCCYKPYTKERMIGGERSISQSDFDA